MSLARLSLPSLSVRRGAIIGVGSGTTPINPLVTAWRAAAVDAGGGVSDARLLPASNLVDTLQAAAINLDALWLLAVDDPAFPQSALIDLIALIESAPSGSPIFSTAGITGNGTTAVIDTNLAPADCTHFTLNSGMFGCYVRTSRGDGSYIDMGTNETGDVSELVPRWSDGNNYANLNGGFDGGAPGPADVKGLWIVNRIDATSVEVWQNDVLLRTVTHTATGLEPSHFNILAGKNSDGSSLAAATHDQISAAYVGALSAPQVPIFAAAMTTFLTAVGSI